MIQKVASKTKFRASDFLHYKALKKQKKILEVYLGNFGGGWLFGTTYQELEISDKLNDEPNDLFE